MSVYPHIYLNFLTWLKIFLKSLLPIESKGGFSENTNFFSLKLQASLWGKEQLEIPHNCRHLYWAVLIPNGFLKYVS